MTLSAMSMRWWHIMKAACRKIPLSFSKCDFLEIPGRMYWHMCTRCDWGCGMKSLSHNQSLQGPENIYNKWFKMACLHKNNDIIRVCRLTSLSVYTLHCSVTKTGISVRVNGGNLHQHSEEQVGFSFKEAILAMSEQNNCRMSSSETEVS